MQLALSNIDNHSALILHEKLTAQCFAIALYNIPDNPPYVPQFC